MNQALPAGFRDEPEFTPDGSVYAGPFSLYDVQPTYDAGSLILTCTISVRMIVDASNSDMLWTDQSVQRGIRPEAASTASRYLSLKSGFPDTSMYVFDRPRAEEIAEKLLRGDRLFLNPLIWNMRPGDFEAHLDAESRRLYVYGGRVYLPDSHHRHQALLHAARMHQQAPMDYPEFSLDRRFTVELYFMSQEDEGEYFYEKNQLGKTADKSKAFDLTTQDNLALAARRAIELSPSLTGNVNRVTDRLTARNRQVMTLSTLVGILRTVAGSDVGDTQVEGLAKDFALFYELLSEVRPELGLLNEADRLVVRTSSMIDQAVVLHGFAPLVKRFHVLHQSTDDEEAFLAGWRRRLQALSAEDDHAHVDADGVTVWQGDVFDRENPLWKELGVLQRTRSGGLTVSNTRQTRATIASVLEDLVGPFDE